MPSAQSSLMRLLHWLDDNILLVLGGFLLAFIPLYPKIPVWSPIEQYIVRVRLEDFFLLFTVMVWGIQVLRKKVAWRSAMLWMIIAYGVISLLSTLSAIFITRTIPLQPLHVAKSFLHYFRYLEYFSFFFVMFAAIRRRQDVKKLLVIFGLTVITISIYGYGQKYFYWPVYSTMNREFSKGERLILTPHARVQSTFAGHYDMAAFLVIALPIILALALKINDKRWKIFLHVSYWAGTWLIIMSASRTSFLAYLLAVTLVVGFTSLQKPSWGQRITYGLSRGIFILVISTVLFMYFGEDLNDRLAQVLDSNQQWHDAFHTWNKQRKDTMAKFEEGGFMAFFPKPTPPPNSITTDEAIAQGILTPSDERPIPATTDARPADVYVNVPDVKTVATVSATGQKTTTTIEVPRTYSDNSLKYGLSMAIRLDTLWPRAIQGFYTNPLLGKGYATLNKESVDQFTEAESTDNNFLRTLGETGLLGFLTFYGCVALVLVYCVKAVREGDVFEKAFSVGLFSATIGLLVNAIYIDVFAASKVALTYWGVVGVFLGYFYVLHRRPRNTVEIAASSNAFASALQKDTPLSSVSPVSLPKLTVKKSKKKKVLA